MFEAVCKAITPPMNADISTTIGKELKPIIINSLIQRVKKIPFFFGRLKTTDSIKKYFPIFDNIFTVQIYEK